MPVVLSGDSRIHYAVAGSGPPLVLHTGLTSTPFWDGLGWVDALKGQYRLFLLDPRGHGASDKPHDPAQYSREHWVGDVLAVLDAEGIDRAHFYGWSLGARVGFGLGARAPERWLSLMLGGHYPLVVDRAAWGGLSTAFVRGMEPVAAVLAPYLSPAMRVRLLANDPQALTAAVEGMFRAPSLEDQLPNLRVPTLILCGDQDPNYAGAARAASLLPHATFVPLAGLDHAGLAFRHELVLPLVTDFLTRVQAGLPTRT